MGRLHHDAPGDCAVHLRLVSAQPGVARTPVRERSHRAAGQAHAKRNDWSLHAVRAPRLSLMRVRTC
eukprot:6214103-Pleurochrysis_carterae.AAC.5